VLFLVFDLGGGTFDVSILTLGDGVFEVQATAGNNHLGGDDFDQLIINYLVDEFKRNEGIDLKKDNIAMQRLRDAAENAKKELSSLQKTNINLPYITTDASGPKFLDIDLTKAKFEQLIEDLVDKTIGPVKQALSDAKLSAEDIDHVLLVGGSTRVPLVQEKIKAVLKIDADKGINPDECVAIGAAIQGGVLTGEAKDIVLLDVTPLTLSIETMGGIATNLIERNTTIPTRKSQIFTTAADNQTSVEIHVVQGERALANDNFTLGKFQLTGIPPAPRGIPQIEVKQAITISGDKRLSDEEIEKMINTAKDFADEDQVRREEIEIRNNADAAIFSAEKLIKERGDKIDADSREKIEGGIESLKKALEGDDTELIKKEIEALTEPVYAETTKMYQEAQAAAEAEKASQAEGSATATDDDNVVDADFEVRDEEKKE